MPSKYCEKLPRCNNAWWCAIDYRPSENVKCFDAMTNYDRVISKTPEELASRMAYVQACGGCPQAIHDCRYDCYECWLDWLKQEVTD